jgi:hypothetical protein
MLFANGDTYDGDWKNDEQDGEGIYLYMNGDMYKGESIIAS